jgi:hypothetical protein
MMTSRTTRQRSDTAEGDDLPARLREHAADFDEIASMAESRAGRLLVQSVADDCRNAADMLDVLRRRSTH